MGKYLINELKIMERLYYKRNTNGLPFEKGDFGNSLPKFEQSVK